MELNFNKIINARWRIDDFVLVGISVFLFFIFFLLKSNIAYFAFNSNYLTVICNIFPPFPKPFRFSELC